MNSLEKKSFKRDFKKKTTLTLHNQQWYMVMYLVTKYLLTTAIFKLKYTWNCGENRPEDCLRSVVANVKIRKYITLLKFILNEFKFEMKFFVV